MRAYDPNLRPQFSQQWNAFVEYALTSTLTAQVGYVGHHADHLVTPVEGNQALPGVGDPSTWAPKNTRRPLFAAHRWSRRSRRRPRGRAAAITRCRPASGSDRRTAPSILASYTLGKTRTNNRGFYGVFGGTGLQGVTSATEGAYWQNTYDPEAEWGPAFHDVRHNFIFSATYELPFGQGRTYGSDWSGLMNAILGGWRVGGIFQARSGLPITVTDGRARSLQGERGSERPNCVGDPAPVGPVDRPMARHQRVPGRGTRHVRQLPGRRGASARLHQSRPHVRQACRHPGARAMPSSASRCSTR